jgi:D-alanine-D-alanine ligase
MTSLPGSEPLPWTKVVFVADAPEHELGASAPETRFDLEKTDPVTLAEVLAAIGKLGLDAVHVQGPRELAEIAPSPGEAVIFSTFGGERSRNRLLLVPALAEILSLDFVGMDAVGQALAANKVEAKRLAAECGVLTPASRIVRRHEGLNVCEEFPLPYVVKPLAEGSSIGIGPQNLIRERAAGRRVAAELLDRFRQPVLVEAFVPGREVSLVCIETRGGWQQALVEIRVEGEPDYFDNHLFDAGEKTARHLPRSVQLVPEGLTGADEAALNTLLHAVGHLGYGRVDGKLWNGRFHFLELTPDAWLGRRGQLGEGFGRLGWTYEQVIAEVLRSASLRPRVQAASG